MQSLAISLFVAGILICLILIIIVVRILLKQHRLKDRSKLDEEDSGYIEKASLARSGTNGDDEDFVGHSIHIKNRFQLPVSYEKIQNQKPWKHRALPTVSVTQHGGELLSSPTSTIKQPSMIDERRKSISLHWLTDLHKSGKHVSSLSAYHSGGESGEEYDYLTTASLSDDGSLTASSVGSEGNSAEDNGKDRYVDSNVHGIKKRITTTRRRLGSNKTHHTSNRPSFKKTGKLSFESEYIRNTKKLTLNILHASDLLTKLDIHHVNPFVRAYLVPGKIQKQQTKVKRETKEPVFNETLTFNNIEEYELQRHKIRLKVYNHSRMKKHQLIGEVDIALISLDIDTKEYFDVDLYVKKSEKSNASMLISICHEAALSKLQVNIEEAKNLAKENITGLNPDPYVIINLYKGDTVEKKETLHLRNTRSPKFNESFQFHLVTDFEYPLSVFSLVVTMANRSMIGRDEALGHVIFSLDSPQSSAVNHWKAVHTDPHKTHLQWHTLLAPEEI